LNRYKFFAFILIVFMGSPSWGWSNDKCSCKKREPISGPFVTVEGHMSMFSDIADWSLLAGSFGYAARGGYRWDGLGLFLHLEHNFWVTTEFNQEVVSGAYNIGIGGEIVYADGFIHSSVVFGPSILGYDTPLDRRGKTGLFFELRPMGLRWSVHERVTLGLDPLNIAIVAPVLAGVPLIFIQYRTIFYVEGTF
jgi:hypothetical protein